MALAVALPTAGPMPVGAQSALLADELRGLLANHPQIAADQAKVQAGSEGERVADSRFLPRLTLDGDAGREHTDSPGRRATGLDHLNTNRYRSTLELRQNLFDGFESTASRKIARTDREIAEQTLRATRQAIVLEGVAAYFDVLRHAELTKLARRNVSNIETQLQLEDERVQRGSGIAVDVLLAKSRLQIAKERRVTFERAFNTAVTKYTQVYGHPPVIGEMRLPAPPTEVFPAELESAEEVVFDYNPAVQAGQLRAMSADEARNIARAEDYPLVDLVAKGNYEDNVDGVPGIRRDYSLRLEFRWELFSGFATQARKARRAYEYNSARNEALFVERKAIEELRLAWYEFRGAADRRELLVNAVNIAGEVFDFRRELRDAGQESAINVLDAENELYNVCINYLNAEFDSRILRYRVLRAIGRLTPAVFGIEDTPEPGNTVATGASPQDVKAVAAVPQDSSSIDGAEACGL